MKVIDKLVDIANNGTSEIMQYFRYYNRHDKQFDSCMLSLNNLIYKLNNGSLDINDEIKVIDENTLKEDKIGKVNTYVLCDNDFNSKGRFSLKATELIDKAFEEYSNKINEIIERLNGMDNE